MNTKLIIQTIASVLFVLYAITASSQDSKTRSGFNVEDNLAIQGYDPVAYFTQNKAVEGNKNISLTYQSIEYRFATTSNRDLFKSNPAKYEPMYGGWCAYAMGAKADKVDINPKTFKIVDGKLYLFYNAFFNNTLDSWNKDQTNLLKKADVNWSKISKK